MGMAFSQRFTAASLATFLFSIPISALSIPSNSYSGLELFRRDALVAACGGDTSRLQCSGAASNFCCAVGTSCMFLNNTGTNSVLCCPSGTDCNLIESISCDITLQDPKKTPKGQLFTSNLSATLPKCGSRCCPLGYECNDSGACRIKDETRAAPSTGGSSSGTLSSATSSTSSKSASSVTATPTFVSLSSPTRPSSTISTASPTPNAPLQQTQSNSNPSFPAKAVLAGLFPGIVAGVLLSLLVFCCLRRRRNKSPSPVSRDSVFGASHRVISDPIYDPAVSDRSEFLHQRSLSQGTSTTKFPSGVAQSQTMGGMGALKRLTPLTFNGRVLSDSPGASTTHVTPAQQTQYIPYRPPSALPPQSQQPGPVTPTRPPRRQTPNPNRLTASTVSKFGSFIFTKSPSVKSNTSRITNLGRSLSRRKEESSETIDVLMPPISAVDGEGGQRMTTFTTLMADAGYESEDQRAVRQASVERRA